jgi:hypothetical protein
VIVSFTPETTRSRAVNAAPTGIRTARSAYEDLAVDAALRPVVVRFAVAARLRGFAARGEVVSVVSADAI